MIRSGLLLGSDHQDLGEFEIEEVSPLIAIGISRGRFPKGYAHVDPNEDAVFAATDGATTILAVADGHNGFDAARAAILAIADTAPTLIEGDPEDVIRTLVGAAVESVARRIPNLDPPRDTSRAALTICVVRGTSLVATTIGDTACFVATRRRVDRVGSTSRFLSPTTDSNKIQIETTTVRRASTVLVVSDGIVDFTRPLERTIRATARQDPREVVDSLIAAAFAGGAGDHITVAAARSSSG